MQVLWFIKLIWNSKIDCPLCICSDGEKPPYDRVSLTDDVKPLESDEDSILGDYDDDAEMSKFNEEGSFIGVYMDKKGQGQTPVDDNQTTV